MWLARATPIRPIPRYQTTKPTHPSMWAPPAPLIGDDPDGNVIHLRSLTKATSPNLRVAALAARGPVLGRLQVALTIDSLLVPAVLQYTALEVVTSPGCRRARAGLQSELGHRRDLTVEAVVRAWGRGRCPTGPEAAITSGSVSRTVVAGRTSPARP